MAEEAVQGGYVPGEHARAISAPIGPVYIISGSGFIFDATGG